MRTLLALLMSYLLPAQGKRRATTPAPTQHPLTDEPTQTLDVVRPSYRSPRPAIYLRGEDTPLIRPYLIAWEREQEREREQEQERQRDRRTAATLAALGIDFHGVTA